MSDTLAIACLSLGWALVHFIWKGALLAGGAALVLAMLRSARPQLRYAVACAALGLSVAVPANDAWQLVQAARQAMALPDGMLEQAVGRAPDAMASIQLALPWLVAAWTCGVALMVARLALGVRWVQSLRRSGHALADAGWQGRLGDLSRRLGLRRKIGLRMVPGLAGPMTVGWLRPVVLLPVALVSHMPPDLLEALLAHELAHVKRMDYLVNLLQCMAEALLFFHPGVWWLSRRIRIERELIADDLAAQALGEPRRLALALEKLSHLQPIAASPALAAHDGNLLDRIKRLMRPARQPLGWRATVPVLGVVLASLMIHAHGATADGAAKAAPAASTAAAQSLPTAVADLALRSAHVLVLDEDSGKVLLQKKADSVVPIASITKLLTAMVVLDAKPDMEAQIDIRRADIDKYKHSASMVPVGAALPRRTVMELALMSSDNRAANALARTYPGGLPAFDKALRAKIALLGLRHTTIQEPSGVSKRNTSTAADVAKMAAAASRYPDITRITTGAQDTIVVQGKPVEYHNTNRFVGQPGWNIELSKTGFTNEAGRCVTMRLKSADKHVTLVLLSAGNAQDRAQDAQSIHDWLAGQPQVHG